jgi:hypothetical protein
MARRIEVTAMRFATAILLTFGLAPSALAQAPKNGTVSQLGRSVQLASVTTCPLVPRPGVACTLQLCPFGCEDETLPVDTPGSVYVHMVVPVRFVAAGSGRVNQIHRRIKGYVHARSATDAVVTFRKRLRTGEVAWVAAEYKGTVRRFFFLPVQKLR